MPAAGYADTPLLRKLGLRPDMKVLLVNPPKNYFELLGQDISSQVVKNGNPGFVHLFAVSRKSLEKDFTNVIQKLPPDAMIWISWYKKAAKIPTDITEDVIREIVLPTGWVDVKVCAVSEQWSGLKIVKRLTER